MREGHVNQPHQLVLCLKSIRRHVVELDILLHVQNVPAFLQPLDLNALVGNDLGDVDGVLQEAAAGDGCAGDDGVLQADYCMEVCVSPETTGGTSAGRKLSCPPSMIMLLRSVNALVRHGWPDSVAHSGLQEGEETSSPFFSKCDFKSDSHSATCSDAGSRIPRQTNLDVFYA